MPDSKFFAKRASDRNARADDYARAVALGGTFAHTHLHVEPFAIGVEHAHAGTIHTHTEPLAHCGTDPTFHAPTDPACN